MYILPSFFCGVPTVLATVKHGQPHRVAFTFKCRHTGTYLIVSFRIWAIINVILSGNGFIR